MRASDGARMLVAAAGFSVQHRCAVCARLLEAWGRAVDPKEQWVCPEHKDAPLLFGVVRRTCANLADPGEAS